MSAQAPAEPDPLIGMVLASRYQIEVRLGEGAMGAVYKARHVKVGRPFAVKVLHSHLTVDDKLLQRFEREAELAGRLRHPNVIGVIDVGETPSGGRYMVMDFAEGPDLARLLVEAPMPPARIIAITRQLLEGLYHAHEVGLIHRDFKPENVIIERDMHGSEVPRIVDFGIAILREGGDSGGTGRLTTNGLVLGTPHYMAPEQAVADPLDHRIDLFALGIMVYEMLCGLLPFDGTGAEIARANLMLDPPAIARRVPGLEVDPLLEAFARRLMAKSREDRPATAKHARELLDLIERDRGAAAAELGVSLAVQGPKATQDSQPILAPRGDHPGTFPPPIRAAPQPSPVAAAGEARHYETTDEIGRVAPHRRRTVILAAAVAGAAVIGIVVVKLVAGGGEHAAEPRVSTPPPVAESGPAKATPSKPVEVAAVTPADPPTRAPDPRPTPSATRPSDPRTHAAKPDRRPEPRVVASNPTVAAPADRKPIQPKPVEAKPVEPKPAEPKPAEHVATPPADATPAVAKPVDATTLAGQYTTVGHELKALEQAKGADTTTELWARYRLIRITDAMSTQAKRDAAAAMLGSLRQEIRTRSR